MTYQELIRKFKTGNPINGDIQVTPEGVIVLGTDNGEEFSFDFRIKIEGNKFRCWQRDPICTCDPEKAVANPGNGRDWILEKVCDSYDELVTWIYES